MSNEEKIEELVRAANEIAIRLEAMSQWSPAVTEFVGLSQRRQQIIAEIEKLKDNKDGNSDN